MNFKIIQFLFLISVVLFIFSCENDECKYDTDCKTNKICVNNSCKDIPKTECYKNSDCSTNCEDGKTCICDFGECLSKEPCSVANCQDHSQCITTENKPYYQCKCNDNFHIEGENCISNIKITPCLDNAPSNGKSINQDVTLTWNSETSSWSETPNCEWICNNNYHKIEELCESNTKEVDCIENMPKNAISTTIKVNITWNIENENWSTTPDCEWNCIENYTERGFKCVKDGWTGISRGFNHTCGINGGALYCWGSNKDYQLGLGDNYNDLPDCDDTAKTCVTPKKIGNSYDWEKVVTGIRHTCAIKSGDLYCWGSNMYGEAGLGGASPKVPTKIRITGKWIDISAYGYNQEGHTCGILKNGTDRNLYCWGDNSNGQLGLGNKILKDIPTQVGSGKNWLAVTTGSFHSCGIRDDGIYCWGGNTMGGLGIGTIVDEYSPQVVSNVDGWKEITGGWEATCAIDKNDIASCWGNNYYGQLGLGYGGEGNNSEKVPKVINGLLWKHISFGKSHVCGVKDNDDLVCWGHNGNSQLGLVDDVNTPTFVRSNWLMVSAGEYHTCGIEKNNKLFCWGNNNLGQLGVGDKTRKDSPTEVVIQ